MNYRSLLLLLVMIPSTMSGCFGGNNAEEISEDDETPWPQPWERSMLNYTVSDEFSTVSVNGTYGIDNVRSVYVPVDTITAADGGAGITGNAEVHLGLWLPIIEGCDWEATNIS